MQRPSQQAASVWSHAELEPHRQRQQEKSSTSEGFLTCWHSCLSEPGIIVITDNKKNQKKKPALLTLVTQQWVRRVKNAALRVRSFCSSPWSTNSCSDTVLMKGSEVRLNTFCVLFSASYHFFAPPKWICLFYKSSAISAKETKEHKTNRTNGSDVEVPNCGRLDGATLSSSCINEL